MSTMMTPGSTVLDEVTVKYHAAVKARDAACYKLRVTGGMTYRRIGEIMGITPEGAEHAVKREAKRRGLVITVRKNAKPYGKYSEGVAP